MTPSTAAEAYRFVAFADRAALDAALERARRGSAVDAILRSARGMFVGDPDEAMRVLARALRTATVEDAAYLVDSLVTLCTGRGQWDRAATLLQRPSTAYLQPATLAQVARVAAVHGDVATCDDAMADALRLVEDAEDALVRGRTLTRLALTNYQLERFEAAAELAAAAARLFEEIGALRLAPPPYSLLYILHHDVFGDADLARFYAVRYTTIAERVGEVSSMVHGLTGQLLVAAESGDERRLGRLRARLIATQVPTMFRERFAFAFAETLGEMRRGLFAAGRSRLAVLRDGERSRGELALCHALIALCDVSEWNVGDATAGVRRALEVGDVAEPHERRELRIARIVAAAVECILGRIAVAQRLLNVRDISGSTEAALAHWTLRAGNEPAELPPLLRGYAFAIAGARAAAAATQPQAGLTAAEMALLPLLAEGKPVTEIARDLGRRYSTVKTHVERINRKLGVRGRAEAVNRARELGLI